MIIDYFNCDAYKIFFKGAAKPPERCGFDARKTYSIYAKYVEHVMNPGEGGGPRHTRYIAFHDLETKYLDTTTTEKFGPFGLFKRSVPTQKPVMQPDFDSRARFSILGTLFHYDEHYTETGIYEVVDYNDKNLTLLYDVETGLPCLLRQPTNLEEIRTLLHADPRFIAYVDPAVVRAEEIARDMKVGEVIARAAQVGLNRILESQAELGVVFNDAEREERKAFVEEATWALETFMENYNEMTTGAYELDKQVVSDELVGDALDSANPQIEEDDPTSGNN